MGDWAILDTSRLSSETASRAFGVATAGVANVKGAYVQLVAATPFDADWMLVTLGDPSAAVFFLADLAIGAAGVEQIVLANMQFQGTGSADAGMLTFLCPLSVPASTRLALRCQSATASATLGAKVHLLKGGLVRPMPFGQAVTYGAVGGTSRGTTLTAGTPTATKGAWVQLTAATTAPIRWLIIFQGGTGVTATEAFRLDIGIGAAGVEQPVLDNLLSLRAPSAQFLYPAVVSCPVTIPSGTRVAARCDSAILAANTMDALIIGVS